MQDNSKSTWKQFLIKKTHTAEKYNECICNKQIALEGKSIYLKIDVTIK